MVPADSRRIPRVPRYSGYRYAGTDFGYGPLTLYRGAFQRLPLACATCNVPVLQPPGRVATPWVWALPRSLATTGGIINLFSFPAGTKMFQFPALASLAIAGMPAIRQAGCPIRKSPRQWLFAPRRGLSQLITSFIASMSQGIRHAPFTTFAFRPKGRTLILSALPSIVHRTCRKEFPVITVLLVSICQRSLSQHKGSVENNGFEPLTPCLQSRCSSQLS